MASIVKSCDISGVDGYIVDVETKTLHGQPMFSIVGLGDTAVVLILIYLLQLDFLLKPDS